MINRVPLLRADLSESPAGFRAEARLRGDAQRSALNAAGDSEHMNMERHTLESRRIQRAMTGREPQRHELIVVRRGGSDCGGCSGLSGCQRCERPSRLSQDEESRRVSAA